ncbi:TetR/AcrR family transcriptional regulator [Terrimonas sp. NA20]|uniref:TetR/AcrR family transcriptional regulator n=1 Tax=Terrimonas ginsenosidimutans TaxID=2908004 RepID=A0ABS9KWQ0_9BACT|nr:TetR/AcrR family transcriptional regulator [Terrimonas ginsenosidimutans]MCG2616776.1 TetR/AcrR family transcriptional regulator [Terrimonas ginsenosidimutans]
MERKTVAGSIRNAERSKEKFLDAVGQIVSESGFAALGINHIAEVAGLSKKMIYTYFGGLDELIDEYLKRQDFWQVTASRHSPKNSKDGGQAFSREMVLQHFNYVHRNKEFQKILIWGLADGRPAFKQMAEKMEESGEKIFENITDPFFGDKARKYRSIMAVIIAGSYYLNLHGSFNGAPFCGIDLGSTEGRKEIEEALAFLVDQSYEAL